MSELERVVELEFEVGYYREQVRELKAQVQYLQNKLGVAKGDLHVLEHLYRSAQKQLPQG